MEGKVKTIPCETCPKLGKCKPDRCKKLAEVIEFDARGERVTNYQRESTPNLNDYHDPRDTRYIASHQRQTRQERFEHIKPKDQFENIPDDSKLSKSGRKRIQRTERGFAPDVLESQEERAVVFERRETRTEPREGTEVDLSNTDLGQEGPDPGIYDEGAVEDSLDEIATRPRGVRASPYPHEFDEAVSDNGATKSIKEINREIERHFPGALAELTDREWKFVTLLMDGKDISLIAQLLDISHEATRQQKKRVLDKLRRFSKSEDETSRNLHKGREVAVK